MNIIILHGDNTAASYLRLSKFFESAKKRNIEIVRFQKDLQMDFLEIATSNSLFDAKKLILIEGVKNLSSKDIEWIKKNERTPINIVIYNPSPLSVSVIKKFPVNTKVEEFKLPVLLFTFLESTYPKNAKVAVNLFHKIIVDTPVEVVFSMMVKHLRDLYWVSSDAKNMPYPSWRVGKLTSQSKKFDISQLKQMLLQATQIDIDVKKSKGELKQSLDLLLVSNLE